MPRHPTARTRKYRYLLGDSRREAARLRRQARLWDPVAAALFDRINVRPGWRVLEIGPGKGSLHAELRRRVKGPIDAVERSQTFAAALRNRCSRDGFGQGTIWESDMIAAPLPDATYDFIFARWVFLFLPDPEAHLRKLVAALKPGGILAIEDYCRATLRRVPEPPHWENFLAADLAFFASQGGDANIGARLADLYEAVGLGVVDVTPTVKLGRAGSPVWQWVSSYFMGVMPQLAKFAPFTASQAATLRRDWLAAGKRRTSWLIAPTLVDVVGRKPRRKRPIRRSG
jgi:SAM-dependent methyltransferase